MIPSGIERIDKLATGAPDASPIVKGDPDTVAVGVIQDFLGCHGAKMPDIRSSLYGKFGPDTEKALRGFRVGHKLQKPKDEVKVDVPTMKKLIEERARFPRVSRAYVTLVLDQAFTGMMRVLWFVALAEGAGKFTAINTGKVDKQGLSYGILQWAQRRERLRDIVNEYEKQRTLFKTVFGPDATAMAAHVRKPHGGLDDSGQTPAADKKFDLANLWGQRFINAGRERPFQKLQLDVALAKFGDILKDVRTYAPVIRSQRAMTFMIDMANHHGDRGAREVFEASFTAGMTQEQVLPLMVEKSVERVKKKFKDATRTRREFFLDTDKKFFTDDDFNEN